VTTTQIGKVVQEEALGEIVLEQDTVVLQGSIMYLEGNQPCCLAALSAALRRPRRTRRLAGGCHLPVGCRPGQLVHAHPGQQ
jgi:hypothetical protein